MIAATQTSQREQLCQDRLHDTLGESVPDHLRQLRGIDSEDCLLGELVEAHPLKPHHLSHAQLAALAHDPESTTSGPSCGQAGDVIDCEPTWAAAAAVACDWS